MDARNKQLLKVMAKAFEEMRSIDGDFLQENNVTADECFAIMNQTASILRAYIYAPRKIQVTMLASGVNEDERVGKMVWLNGVRDFVLDEALKKLKG